MEGLASLLSGLSLSDKKMEYLSRVKPALSSFTRAEIATGLRSEVSVQIYVYVAGKSLRKKHCFLCPGV